MAKTTLVDWYDTPCWYDLVFEPGTRREGSFLLAMSRRHGRGEARRVLEPACGSGRLVVDLARRGLEVEGFDLNERMLDAARAKLARRGLRADLRAGDMARVPSGPAVDLAHCLVSTFKYLLDERSARAHLAGVARRLAPGGVYVLGLHLTDYRRRGSQVEHWVVERGGARVVCVTRTMQADRRTRLEAVRTRLTVASRGREHAQETNWSFRTYSVREVLDLVRSRPELELVATYDFHHDATTPRPIDDGRDDVVLVLRKRGRGERAAGAGTLRPA